MLKSSASLTANNTSNQFQPAVARLARKTFLLLQMNNQLGEPGNPGGSLAAHGDGELQAASSHAAPVCLLDFLLISLFVPLHFRDEGCLWRIRSSTLGYLCCLME